MEDMHGMKECKYCTLNLLEGEDFPLSPHKNATPP